MKYIRFDSLKESASLSNDTIISRTLTSLKLIKLKTVPAGGNRKAPNFHWPQDVLRYAEGSCFEFSVLLHQVCEMNDIGNKLVVFGIQSSSRLTMMMGKRYETVHMIPLIKDDSNKYYRIVDMTLHLDFNDYSLVSSNIVKALKQVKLMYQSLMYNQIARYYPISINDILVQGPYALGDEDMDTIDKMIKTSPTISNFDFAKKLNSYNVIYDKMDENINTYKSLVADKSDSKSRVIGDIGVGPGWKESYEQALKMLGIDKTHKFK